MNEFSSGFGGFSLVQSNRKSVGKRERERKNEGSERIFIFVEAETIRGDGEEVVTAQMAHFENHKRTEPRP